MFCLRREYFPRCYCPSSWRVPLTTWRGLLSLFWKISGDFLTHLIKQPFTFGGRKVFLEECFSYFQPRRGALPGGLPRRQRLLTAICLPGQFLQWTGHVGAPSEFRQHSVSGPHCPRCCSGSLGFYLGIRAFPASPGDCNAQPGVRAAEPYSYTAVLCIFTRCSRSMCPAAGTGRDQGTRIQGTVLFPGVPQFGAQDGRLADIYLLGPGGQTTFNVLLGVGLSPPHSGSFLFSLSG